MRARACANSHGVHIKLRVPKNVAAQNQRADGGLVTSQDKTGPLNDRARVK